MSYDDLITEKMTVICPKCGEKNEVLWFPARSVSYRTQGSTGISRMHTNRRGEKVQGICKDCNYKFKPKDLD